MALEDDIQTLTKAVQALTAKIGGADTAPKESPKSPPKATTKKGTTLETVAKAFSAFLVSGDDDAKEAVRKINTHFGVKRVSEIPESGYDDALTLLKQYQDGEDPLGDGEDLM